MGIGPGERHLPHCRNMEVQGTGNKPKDCIFPVHLGPCTLGLAAKQPANTSHFRNGTLSSVEGPFYSPCPLLYVPCHLTLRA